MSDNDEQKIAIISPNHSRILTRKLVHIKQLKQ